jgi:hypothetical protein
VKKLNITRRNNRDVWDEKMAHEANLARRREAKELFHALRMYSNDVNDMDNIIKVLEARDGMRTKKKKTKPEPNKV